MYLVILRRCLPTDSIPNYVSVGSGSYPLDGPKFQ